MQLADVPDALVSGFASEFGAEQDGKLRAWEEGNTKDMMIKPVWVLIS
jgi:hypothetical protein